jgi:hypothetical protein
MEMLQASFVNQIFARGQHKQPKELKPEIAPKLIGRRGVAILTEDPNNHPNS